MKIFVLKFRRVPQSTSTTIFLAHYGKSYVKWCSKPAKETNAIRSFVPYLGAVRNS